MTRYNLKGWKVNSPKSSGFTMIEILVVLSIFTLLTTISIPYLSAWYSPIKLRGVQREIVSSLRLTQQNSVTTQKNHLIRFNVPGNSYSLIKKDGGETVLKTTILPSGVTFSSITLQPVVNEVEFNPAAAPNSTGDINLINNKGETKKIEVTPSGFIKAE